MMKIKNPRKKSEIETVQEEVVTEHEPEATEDSNVVEEAEVPFQLKKTPKLKKKKRAAVSMKMKLKRKKSRLHNQRSQ